jgi:miniconductance mechanosensitive channel
MEANETFTALGESWLTEAGLSQVAAVVLARGIIALLIILLSLLANFIARRVIAKLAHTIVQRTRSSWDDIIARRGVFNRLSRIAPALVIYFLNPLAFPQIDWLTIAIQRAAVAYMIGVTILVLDAALDSGNEIYERFAPQSRDRPIKGYVQLIKVLTFIVGGVLVVTTILDRSPVGILSGIGALSAVVLLVFRDSILGLVAGLQLSGNRMVRIGDWIEMPRYDADGDVIDITLQSVKVQNWDKTITTIPIYSLVSDSFRNWRGMSESGGRRIKRSISIDMRTVRFCSPQLVERLRRYNLIRDYVDARTQEIRRYNQEHGLLDTDLLSARRMTNLGTFRAYVAAYLRSHSSINQEMTFLVRHLQPGPTGIPLEIYVFSSDKVWANYESIQADIMDHLLAVLPEFELAVFQEPSGLDVQGLAEALSSPRTKDTPK